MDPHPNTFGTLVNQWHPYEDITFSISQEQNPITLSYHKVPREKPSLGICGRLISSHSIRLLERPPKVRFPTVDLDEARKQYRNKTQGQKCLY
jgi:hypothetical protein